MPRGVQNHPGTDKLQRAAMAGATQAAQTGGNSMTTQHNTNAAALVFHAVGFAFQNRRIVDDPEQVFDLMTLRWTARELLLDLEGGNLLPGLLICPEVEGGRVGVVVPDPAGGQAVEVWRGTR
jgi:hypothetical protein